MKSKIDQFSINEDDSRAIISRFCRKKFWKYRKMEWDNDIDGEIEIFDQGRETTAKFIKVQLKTVDDPKKFEGIGEVYKFDADIKFLHFCDVCDIPIILSVFNIHEETGYFIFMQRFIYEHLDLQNPQWRRNKSNVRVNVPLENSLQLESAKSKLKFIANEGVNLITQLRKTATYKKYYSVLKQDDNSHGTALRTSLKILVEKSFANSKEAMRILIPKINHEYRGRVYHRNQILAQTHNNKEYDVIYMFFYDTLNQAKQGLTFCRTLWIKDNLPDAAKPMVSKSNEVIDEINIYWDSNDSFDEFIEDNLLDKGQYLPIIDNAFDKFTGLYEKVLFLHNQYKQKIIISSELISEIKLISNDLDNLNNSLYPPYHSHPTFLPPPSQQLIQSLHRLIGYPLQYIL